MSTHALTFLGEPVSGRNRAKTHRAVPPALNERNRLWLLKNSISQNWSKKLCARKSP
jgi:hypothetical protein